MTYHFGKADGITVKSARELESMQRAGSVVAQVKKKIKEAMVPGVTSQELDEIAEKEMLRLGAIPSFKGYMGMALTPFPATICVSFNEEIVHGIPGCRKLMDGDIVSVDVGAIVEGFHGDSAFTVGVGRISEEAERLIAATSEALTVGISQAQAGSRLSNISNAVQIHAEKSGYSVVREYVGHGIGRSLHEDPQVPNYGMPGKGPRLRSGMTIAIEPMLNIGGWETMQMVDGWTVSTADGSLSAHFEHTVAITDNGPEVLT